MKHTNAVIFLLGLAVLPANGCSKSAPATSPTSSYSPRSRQIEVEVANVVRQPIAAELEFTGNLLPRRATRIMAEVNGMVKEIPRVGAKFDVTINGQRHAEQLGISFGQAVREGDLLVQLDPRDFEIELRIAQAKLIKARADLAKLRSWDRPEEVRRLAAMRNEVVARLEQSQKDLVRMKKLVATRAVAPAEYEQAAMNVSTAAAMVDSAEASLAKAKAGPTAEEVAVQQALVAQAEAEVEQKAWQLAKTTIRAPYDGVVTAINVEIGERVSMTGEPLVELMNLRYLVAEIGVPEAYVRALQVHDKASVVAAGSTAPVPGLVVAINEMVDAATRTFRVRVAIDNAMGHFKAGQFASVRLQMNAAEGDSLVAPSQSLVFIEGEPHVFVLEGNRVHQTSVQPGLASKGMVEILSGVEPGDQIVVDDPSLLADGMEISIKPEIRRVSLNVPSRTQP